MFYLIKVSNVIVVGRAEGAKMPNYLQSVANTWVVGAQVATLIQTMQEAGLPLDNVHLAGLSLGAQVSGYTGEKFQGRIPRLTGDFFSALPDSHVTFLAKTFKARLFFIAEHSSLIIPRPVAATVVAILTVARMVSHWDNWENCFVEFAVMCAYPKTRF
jgi:pimeloyl-ACP methyl ester carboxylesterase